MKGVRDMEVYRININDREITAAPGKSILQAALENGIEIPHLCYDERIQPYGACGLCVVEVEGSPKLQRACATPISDGMIIVTNTSRTVSARKTALKLLVSDHRGDCRPPCSLACPGQTDCQGYVGLIANGQYKEAVELIKDKLPLPASVGRICPHPCETACRRQLAEEPVSICALKAFVGDKDLEGDTFRPEIKPATGKSIAVVGSGPAGLSCAYFLAKEGHYVTIFEAMPEPGGMLRYGIPEYRLPKSVLDEEVELIKDMGIEIKYNTKLGEDITLDFLKKQYDAVFLGIGAWESSSMRCTGEEKNGVLGGIDFLRDVTLNNPVNLGRKVLVVGGGNTAMDVARSAARLGAQKVSVLYRRTREEMPAEDIEIEEAEEEGIEFIYLVAPIEVVGNENKVSGLRCQKMRLGEPDASGRRKPEPIPGEEIIFEADTIVAAIGQQVKAKNIHGLSLSKHGTINVKEGTFETNIPGVFAGGDAVTGPKIAIEAVAQGKNCADVIHSYLRGKIVPVHTNYYVKQDDLTEDDFVDRVKIARVPLTTTDAKVRKSDFRQVTNIMTEEEAKKESARCLECGCRDYFECQLLKYIQDYDINTDEVSGEKHKRRKEDDHPFIERNPDKCILCGLCVRACDEIMGITALGLVDRGFDSIVSPEFGLPLKESDCISCGQCASVCPTGACMEKEAVKKQIPLDLNGVDTVCGFCSVGCNLTLEYKGDYVYRAVPDMNVEEGLLCGRGRFGLNHINDDTRLAAPLIGGNEARFDEAILYLVKKLQSIRATYGKESIAIAISPRFTNEEAFVIRKLSEKLDTNIIGAFTPSSVAGLKDVMGYAASTNSFDELYNTELILSIGNVAENHPVMGIKMKNAASGKAKLISVSSQKTRAQEWSKISSNPENSLDFFKALIKALIEMGFVNEKEISKSANGFEELKNCVSNVPLTDEIRSIAKMYGEAKKAMILVDGDTVTKDAVKLLANIAVITRKVGAPHRGIIVLDSKNNSQGMLDMGIQKSGDEILSLINAGIVKALVVIGEDPVSVDSKLKDTFEKLEFLGVLDMFMTDTAKQADLVLPLVSFAETDGSFTRADRKIQTVQSVLNPLTGMSNFDLLLQIADDLGAGLKDFGNVKERISIEIPEYSGLSSEEFAGKNVYWPNTPEDPNGKQVLYGEGFNTTDGKAVLALMADGPLFKEKVVYDTVEKEFLEYVKSQGARV